MQILRGIAAAGAGGVASERIDTAEMKSEVRARLAFAFTSVLKFDTSPSPPMG
jgi:hypothetical protein